MSILACLSCHAEVTNGLALCELCQRKVSTDLTYLPVYFRNLARWRPGRAGSRQVPGSRVLYDGTVRGNGTGDRISDTLDEAHNALMTWARLLVEDRDLPRPLTMADAVLLDDLPSELAEELNDDKALAVAWLCAGIEHHLTSLATRSWCGEFARDLATHEARLRGLTETSVPGWYAGACRRKVALDRACGAPTYVIPGLTWVTCGACGATTYARDHLDVILDEAREWVAPPKRLAEAIVALVDTEQSQSRLYDRIRQWSARGDIKPVHRTVRDYVYDDEADRLVVAEVQVGRARYRFGDVFDQLGRDTRHLREERIS